MNGRYYDLQILPLFEDDLNEIVDYITFRLKKTMAAEKLVDDVERAIEERRSCAEAFELYPSSRDRLHPYYRIRVRNFTIFYVVIDGTMEVRRILYSKSNVKKKL